ncbi:hypothetical protein PG995_007644 [Apiospora arundinis]
MQSVRGMYFLGLLYVFNIVEHIRDGAPPKTANFQNPTGGVGCEPGYNYFPAQHTKIHVTNRETRAAPGRRHVDGLRHVPRTLQHDAGRNHEELRGHQRRRQEEPNHRGQSERRLAAGMSTNFGMHHVPCNTTLGDIMTSFGATNTTLGDIMTSFGATNADAKKNRVTKGLGATNADAKNRVTEVNPSSVLVGNCQRDASVPLEPMGVSSQH